MKELNKDPFKIMSNKTWRTLGDCDDYEDDVRRCNKVYAILFVCLAIIVFIGLVIIIVKTN